MKIELRDAKPSSEYTLLLVFSNEADFDGELLMKKALRV